MSAFPAIGFFITLDVMSWGSNRERRRRDIG